jgi:TonB dependent receptor/Carboxypeptidase regulatory-like domain
MRIAAHPIVVRLLGCVLLTAVPTAALPQEQPVVAGDTGRVVVTVTTLEGGVHLSGVHVELHSRERDVTIARSTTNGAGQVLFTDVPSGHYLVEVSRDDIAGRTSTEFTVRAGETAHVLLDTRLAFVMPELEIRAAGPSPTDTAQPVSASDMLAGELSSSTPLQGDDFQSLLPLLPGVVRDSDGRLRLKGGQPSQSALQVSSASLIDPSTGDFDLDLPAQSVESVEVLPNPFAAEYGRFSTSITQIRTRPGTNVWDVSPDNLVPRVRGFPIRIRAFEPRLSVRGPIKRDRLFFSEDLQFRYVATPVRSLPGEPEMNVRSFDSFTRLDGVVSSRHLLGGGVILFPRELGHVTMSTFRPQETTPDLNQSGWSTGIVDRFAIASQLVLETTLSVRRFEVEVNTDNHAPMVYAPEGQRGGFFHDQERNVTSVQWVEALSLTRALGRGEHVIKLGSDLQFSRYHGTTASRPVEIRRLDGTLAERTDFAATTSQRVSAVEAAVFAQDRWRVGPRVTFEMGLRLDRDAIVERVNWSPRAGAAVSVLPEGRGILRGGYGTFVQRTPLNVGAFTSFASRTVTRFGEDGAVIGGPTVFTNHVDGRLRTPRAYVGNLEWNQRFGRQVLLKLGVLRRRGQQEYVVSPTGAAGLLQVSSIGRSRYTEFEATARYLGSARRDLTLSYVRARSTADLNNYDQFYGNVPNPVVRANEHGPTTADVPHRILLRGSIGLPWQWEAAPVLELRSGFPWSAVDQFQDFVGPRGRAGRLPAVRTLDLAVVRPWRIKGYRLRAGLRLYNIFGATAERDVQTNVTSPAYGRAFNPVDRSIGVVLGLMR